MVGFTNDIGRLTGEGFGVQVAFGHGERADGRTTRRSVGARTIAEAFRLTAEDFADRVAVRTKDDEVASTWAQLRDRVDALAGGLPSSASHGRHVALMLDNRPEFHIADLAGDDARRDAVLDLPDLAPEQIAYVVADAGARVADRRGRVRSSRSLEARDDLPGLEHVIVLDGDAPDGTSRWPTVEGADPDFDAEAALARGRARRRR